jgi:lysozyme
LKLKTKVAAGLTAATLTGCAVFVTEFEGVRLQAYLDPVNIPTVCMGETEGVKMGDRYTPAQCLDMLKAKLPRYWGEIANCIGADLADSLPDTRKIAFTSFAYNVGSGAFCRSTLLRRLKEGQTVAACNELLKWNRAGRKIFSGLERRRQAERKLCLEGAI